jgi:hypothetical protein
LNAMKTNNVARLADHAFSLNISYLD